MSDLHIPNNSTPKELQLNRRKALGVFGTGALATLASTTPASAFLFGGGKKDVDLSGLPQTWVNMQGRNLEEYADYLAGLKLKYVTPRQVIQAHAKRRGSCWNMIPPKSLWKNMKPTLKAVDRVAAELNQPVREVLSAYRSPQYNARCSGAKRRSWHMSNVAIDVKFHARPSTVAHVARHLRSRGKFSGGVGRYYSFTHIDTRGQNVDW